MLGGGAADIAAGDDHVCALMVGGEVRCWGSNQFGETGNGLPGDNFGDEPGEMPPPPVNLGGPAIQVVAGLYHSCALLDDASVRCWGRGLLGALGQGDTLDVQLPEHFPPPAVDLGADAVRLASHLDASTCALLVDGVLRCWGNNEYGQLGYGHIMSIGDDDLPASAGPVPYR